MAGIIILGIQFNMIWSEFPKDRLEKICSFDQTTCAFGPFFLVCLGKIYFSPCVYHLINFVRCGILFYTKWCEFQRDLLEKVWIFQPKYCVFELVLLVYLQKIYSSTCDGLLVGIVECRIKFRIQHRVMERISGRNTRSRCSHYWLHTCTSFFMMSARNLSDKFVTFYYYLLSRVASIK
jgi:hypothetical protein